MKRASGVLLHITSLPGSFGVGDFGGWARRFRDFLEESGQAYWQILPLNPIDGAHGNTPYSSISAFAGNPLLISPEGLVKDGLLKTEELEPVSVFSAGRADYSAAARYKSKIFVLAYERFKRGKEKEEYKDFCDANSAWLEDFAVFSAVRDHFKQKVWSDWPADVRDRDPAAVSRLKRDIDDEIGRRKFLQYVFFKQWVSLKRDCNEKGIKIIGDVPIYVNYDSADAWTNRGIFKLDERGRPTSVAGVPPDYFSRTGQLWGNPVYRWDVLEKDGFGWWIKRIGHNLRLFDRLRMDHFRGFAAAWEVPYGERTAENGSWVKVPGKEFFDVLIKRFPKAPIIVEDLGVITQDVKDLIKHFGFPGMKVLIFGFGGDMKTNPNAPKNHVKNCAVYTGTHDSNTVRGWFEAEAGEEDKTNLYKCLGREVSPEEVPWEFVRMAESSAAETAIIPMQDILGLPAASRMNTPGTVSGNWEWRLLPEQISHESAQKLLGITRTNKRI